MIASYENNVVNNINVDLMLALPTQTEDDLVDSLLKVINLNPKQLNLNENTYPILMDYKFHLQNFFVT